MVPVRIYVTEYCGYCRAAEALLTRKGVAFEAIDCTDDAETRRQLVEQTGRRTVPQIFIAGVPIGGYDELSELERDGELDGILAGERAPDPA
jgi:glutaredoxin 3